MGGQHRRRIQRREITKPQIVSDTSLEKLSWAFFGIAIVYAVARALCFPDMTGDTFYRVAVAKNFLTGQGWGWTYANFEDLSKPYFNALYKWPPLTSMIVVPLFALFKNIHWPVSLVMIFSIVVFFTSWFIILKLLSPSVSSAHRALLWFFWGFCFNPFLILQADGYLAMAFYSGSLMFQVWMVRKEKNFLFCSLASGLLMGFAIATRFTYWPLAAAGPASLIILGFLKDRKWIRPALIQAGLSAIFIGLTNYWGSVMAEATTFMNTQASSAATVLATEDVRATADVAVRTWRYWDWFILKALGLEDIVLFFKDSLSFKPWETIFGLSPQGFFLIPLIIAFVIFLFLFAKQFEREKKDKQSTPKLFVSLFGLLTLILVNITLALLTIKFFTTFVVIPRYFVVIYPFILLTFTTFLFSVLPQLHRRPFVKKSFLIFVLLLFGTAGIVRGKRFYEQATNLNNFWQLRERATKKLSEIFLKPSEHPVVFLAAWGYWRESVAAYHGIPTEAVIEPGMTIATQNPVKIIFPLSRDIDQDIFSVLRRFKKDFKAKHEGILYEKWETVDIYSVVFPPGSYEFQMDEIEK